MILSIGFAALGCSHRVLNERPEERSAQLDRLVDSVIQRYQLPGLAVGIVQDDRVIYRRVAGETRAGSGERITERTLFKIASNSKAMTTAVLARLVEQGKLRWDDPVVKHLPQFKMYDPWVTQQMQVRDLLIHNSGLRSGAGDLMLWPEPNAYTRADIIAGLAHLKPMYSFRSRYDYDNLLYVVAGEVIASITGMSYEEAVAEELFEPLQMTGCRAGSFALKEAGSVAQPHMRTPDGNAVIRQDEALVPASTSAAAGGIRCGLEDMLKWVRMWLHPQLHDAAGKPWLTTGQRTALWTAHMPMPLSERQRRWDGSRFNAYGYGWRLSDVDGVLRVAHTGTLAGMYSAVILLPEQRTGIVFMINGDGSLARTVLSQVLVKQFTRPERSEDVGYYADELDRDRQLEASSVDASQPPPRFHVAPAEIAQWLGIYRDPWFGEANVCESGGAVRFMAAKSPQLTGTVMRSGERLLVDWDETSIDAEPWLHFDRSADGTATLHLTKVDPNADFSYDYEDLSFGRVAACR